MASYGIDFFGQTLYGRAPLAVYGAFPTATCIDYATIRIDWVSPPGTWSRVRLVRNTNGYSLFESDGSILLDSLRPAPMVFTDTGLTGGRRYYYTLWFFAYQTQEWVRGGDASDLVTADHGSLDAMWDRLPQMYRTDSIDNVTGSTVVGSQLYRFLSVFGFCLDTLRSEYESLLDVASPSAVSVAMLPAMLTQLGFAPDPELGWRAMRRLAADATYFYARKGTSEVLEDLTTVATGWDASYATGRNIVLDNLDALAELSVGRWSTDLTNCRIEARSNNNVVSGLFGNGYLAMIDTAGSAPMSASIVRSGRTARLHGIPIVAGLNYVATAYARGSGNASIDIDWYDAAGVPVSTSRGATGNPASSSWSTRLLCRATAPLTARYAGLQLNAVTSTQTTLFNAVQFEQRDAADPVRSWKPARQALITVFADHVNEVVNPRGAAGVQGWSATGTLTSSSTGFTLTWNGPTQTAVNDQRAATTAAQIKVTPGQNWSAMVEVNPGTTMDISFSLLLYGGGVLIGNSPITWATGTPGSWSPVNLSYTVPSDGSVTSIVLRIAFTHLNMAPPLTAGAALNFRDVGLVQAAAVPGYFDGATSSPTADYLWEGLPDNSRSHYYSRRTLKAQRLRALLPEFLPNGVVADLLFAQPAISGVGADSGVVDLGSGDSGGLTPVAVEVVLEWALAITWSEVLADYATWDAVKASNLTWEDVLGAKATTWSDVRARYASWTAVRNTPSGHKWSDVAGGI